MNRVHAGRNARVIALTAVLAAATGTIGGLSAGGPKGQAAVAAPASKKVLTASVHRLVLGQTSEGFITLNSLWVWNASDQPIVMAASSLSGSSDFRLYADGLVGKTLQPGEYGYVSVVYEPADAGVDKGVLTVSETTFGTQLEIALSGRK